MINYSIQAIIFDMDGVLVDSEFWWCKFEDQFYREIMPDWNEQDHGQVVGQSLKDIHQLLSQKYQLRLSWPEFQARYHAEASNIYQTQVNLMPGAAEVLADLAERGIILALASSSFHSWIEMVVERFDIKKYFKIIVSSEDVGERGKPAPDIYLFTAKKLGVDPQDCLVIEDSTNGILSAKAAGMTAVAYKSARNPSQKYDKADSVIDDLTLIYENYAP